MAEENPQNIDPNTDPQVEDTPSTAVPLTDIDTSAAEVNAATDPEVPQPTDTPELVTTPLPDEIPIKQKGDELVDLNTGEIYGIDPETGFINSGQDLLIAPDDISVQRQGDVLVDLNSGEEYPIDPDSGFVAVNDVYTAPEDLLPGDDPQVPEGGVLELTPNGDVIRSADQVAAINKQNTLDNARKQATLKSQRKQSNDRDWRVRLRLAPRSQYLYNSPQPGILQPLAVTDGVIFPYTPTIQTVYRANYNKYDLTHSNYRGYFYQGSTVEDIQINAVFTAQDSAEAAYLLAVITFFKSITKMFYGNDAERGAPPPLCYLSGLGQYQFAEHPVAVGQFNYNLPADVDYIRANSPNINGTNLLQRRNRQDLPTNPISGALQRLANAGIKKGAIPSPPAPPTLGTASPTYVPTKIEISLVLHPMQSRQQVSQQFSLKQFANGDLIKGGFW